MIEDIKTMISKYVKDFDYSFIPSDDGRLFILSIENTNEEISQEYLNYISEDICCKYGVIELDSREEYGYKGLYNVVMYFKNDR